MITREQIITHIMQLRKTDTDYARYSLGEFNKLLPWAMLNEGVREAIKWEQSNES